MGVARDTVGDGWYLGGDGGRCVCVCACACVSRLASAGCSLLPSPRVSCRWNHVSANTTSAGFSNCFLIYQPYWNKCARQNKRWRGSDCAHIHDCTGTLGLWLCGHQAVFSMEEGLVSRAEGQRQHHTNPHFLGGDYSLLENEWKSLSHVRLFATPWTIQFMEFSRPRILEWVAFPFPSSGYLLNPGIELRSPTLQVDSLPAEPQGKPENTGVGSLSLLQQIFPTQESNQVLLHCRQILYYLNHEGSLKIWEVNIKIFSPHMFNVSYIAKFLRGVKYETELWELFVQKLCFERECDKK